jgi:hypothetical protein
MKSNPYLERKARAGIGAAGRASEHRLAKSLKGRQRPASGAVEGAKGDIAVGDFLVEAKSTHMNSIALNRDWLLKIAAEARSENKTPALAISFTTENGSPILDGDWVCIRMVDFRNMGGV